MLDSVKNALEGGGINIAEGGVFLISESLTTSASGLVVYFLARGIQDNQHVCFVSFEHNWGHYCNIGNKFGINLRHQTNEGKIQLIEPLKLLTEVLDDGFENVDHPFSFVTEQSEHSLRNLYKLVAKTVEPMKQKNENFIIVIDGINFLLNLGIEVNEIEVFFTYCKTLIESNESCKNLGTLLVVTKSYDKDEDASRIVSKVAHSSDIHIALEGLRTGLSREVHGNMKIICNSNSPQNCIPDVQIFQYKMEDKNIKLFAPGTSSRVL